MKRYGDSSLLEQLFTKEQLSDAVTKNFLRGYMLFVHSFRRSKTTGSSFSARI